MPLNRETGEPLPIGRSRPVPAAKYRELTEVRVPYLYEEGKQFKSTREGLRPMYLDAITRAADAFKREGAMLPISFPEDAILVHEYPDAGLVEFVFAREVAGKELYVRIPPYPLHPSVIGWLKATNRWS